MCQDREREIRKILGKRLSVKASEKICPAAVL